jgi:hypothetical protein
MRSRFPFAPTALPACLALVALSCGSSTPATLDAGHTSGDSGCASTASETLVGLVIKNFDGGCSVTVNGDVSLSGSGTTTICQKPGLVTLTAMANTGFTLGSQPWHDTATESGGSATVTLTSGSTCVWVCCPGKGGTPACPTADQCP